MPTVAALTALTLLALPGATAAAERPVAPIDLVGSFASLGESVAKGERLPAGASVVDAVASFPAGDPAASQEVRLACPAGSPLVDGPYINGLPRELRPSGRAYTPDVDTATTVRVTAAADLPAPRAVRVLAACLEAERLPRLRAAQRADTLERAARTRPEVRTAPTRFGCFRTNILRSPGRVYQGSLARGVEVRVLRRSRSGRWAEVLALRPFGIIGWVETRALCRTALDPA